MSTNITILRPSKDCRLRNIAPNQNNGSVTTGTVGVLDSLIYEYNPLTPYSGPPLSPSAVLLSADKGVFTELKFTKTGGSGTLVYVLSRLLVSFVEGEGNLQDNPTLLPPFEPYDKSGASYNHRIYGTSPVPWNSPGASGASDIEPASERLTFSKSSTNETFTVRPPGGGGIEVPGLVPWLQRQINLGIIRFRHTTQSGSHTLTLREHAQPPEITLVWTEPDISSLASGWLLVS